MRKQKFLKKLFEWALRIVEVFCNGSEVASHSILFIQNFQLIQPINE